ncbi:lPXTG-motif cell wall anchor domain protein [Clostridium sp. CAG:277]|nr:lPXTG-motif cell wall anchor domain protein [Clostridium sp. CAG:277]
MKKKRVMGRIRYKSAAIKLKKAVAVLMAALMMGSAVDYTALPAACAAEDVTGEQVAELTQDGKTTVYSSFMEAYQAITTSDKATIKLLQDSRISKITGSKYITYITDKEHTIVLDLNGHTLSTEEVSGWDSKESTYVLDIDTSSNWTICSGVPGGKIQDSGSKAALLENYGTLAIGGNVEITSNSEYTVFARGGTGNLSIDGAAIDKVGVMYGSCKITSGNIDNVFWRGGKAEISGGKIGTVSVIGDYAGWSKGSNLQLCGGTIGLLKQREEYTKAMSTWFAAGTAIKSIEGGSLYTRAGIDAIEAVEGYRCAENIEMVPCGNHVNESGYCMYCAAATECEHIYGEDGICTNCGMVAIATIKKDNQLTGYITYGELCQAVSEFTPDTTATIKIIKDVDLNQSLAFREGKITLDLGGHKIETARVNTVIVSDHAEVTIQNGTLKTREKDVVRAEGGKLTLEKSTTVSSSDYYYYYAGLRIDGGEVTIDGAGFVDGERSVDITGGNLTVLDGTFSGQFRKYFYNGEESPEVFLRGGSYSDVRSLKGNLRSMLENGYGFRSREEGTAWIVDSDLLDGEGAGEDTAKIVLNVTVEKLPVTITQPESYEDYCGNPASLYVNVDAAEEVTYQWYRITGEGNAEEISDATSNTLQISPLEFQPGVGITFYCMIYWQGYSIKSEEATVTLKEKIDFYVNTAIEKYYTGEAVTLQEDEISLYLKDGSVNNTLVPGKDFKIVEGSYEHNTDATTQDKMASVTVEGIGKYKGTVQVRFSILQAENEFTGELTCEDYVYDGVAVPNPEAAAKFGTVKYRYAASETGEYTDVVPKSAGIYYVKAYVTETNNYTGLESREAAKFVVFKAKQPENTPKDSITTPYTAKKVSQVELPADWQWVEEDASKDLPESEAVEAKADYAGQDKDLYITKQVTITITRSACEHPDTKVKGEEASTCTTAGYTGDTYCEQCGRKIKEGKEIALLPHILEKIEKKNATTVKEGNIEYYHCSVCDGCFSDSEGTSPITKESTVIPVIKVTPTVTPTAAPSAKPTTEPGVEPTETPGAEPGVKPTAVPSAEPGVEPTAGPSAEPGAEPTAKPTAGPGAKPTAGPSAEPGAEPTVKPTAEPTETPGAEPTAKPTAGSTAEPGGKPTAGPSEETTAKPGGKPTAGPSVSPAAEPTVTPSAAPTETPAGEPAIPKPTKKPVVKPAKKGKKLTDSKGAIYKVTSDKKGSPTVEYSAAVKGAKGTITIPAQVTIKGVTYKVTSVGASACRNRAGITKVIIGKNVKKIGNRVFSGCKKLKKVTIKTTKLTESTVGSNAFSGISSGVVVKVPESKVKAYRKLFKKKGISDGATITK